MNEFLRILQSKLDTMKPNFGDDADSVLSILCGAYYDQNCNSDSEEIKQAFEDLYEAMIASCVGGVQIKDDFLPFVFYEYLCFISSHLGIISSSP